MAKEPKFLSFHTNSALQHSTHGFSLLQASKRDLRNHKTGMHSHDFWQLEIILAGDCRLQAGSQECIMQAGEFVLIPPRQEHIFYYGRRACQLMSIKFMWAETHEHKDLCYDRIQLESFISYIVDLYDAAVDDERQLPGFSTAMLAYLLNLFSDDVQVAETESAIVRQVDEIIHRQQGQALSVKEIAYEMHYTVNHLSAAYARESGQTIKHTIDTTRCEYAKQLLRYEEDSISQIADILGFVDVFSFSRFFHRVSGMRPKEFRKTKL
ncbi:MAG: helix-turn-helix transcriptional regulator [Planctomycetes bacterium]|nr:helix-turn-helix transcriptional regulator [Planctomycetota bacterium]